MKEDKIMNENENENIDVQFNKIASLILKQKRMEKGYSLEDVVNKMHNTITRQSLFKYENNKARIKIRTFKDICKVLALDPDEVIEEITKKTYISNFIIKDDKLFDEKDTIDKLASRPNNNFINQINDISEKIDKELEIVGKNLLYDTCTVEIEKLVCSIKKLSNRAILEEDKEILIKLIYSLHERAKK